MKDSVENKNTFGVYWLPVFTFTVICMNSYHKWKISFPFFKALHTQNTKLRTFIYELKYRVRAEETTEHHVNPRFKRYTWTTTFSFLLHTVCLTLALFLKRSGTFLIFQDWTWYSISLLSQKKKELITKARHINWRNGTSVKNATMILAESVVLWKDTHCPVVLSPDLWTSLKKENTHIVSLNTFYKAL